MACCLTTMTIRLNSGKDYKNAQEWCRIKEEDGKLDAYGESHYPNEKTITYEEQNIDSAEAKELFKDFAGYMTSCGAEPLTMHFNIAFDNCGEEYQLLYTLKDGAATERMASCDVAGFDDEEDYYDDEDDDGYFDYDDEKEDTYFDRLDDWYDHPDYGEPVVIPFTAKEKNTH